MAIGEDHPLPRLHPDDVGFFCLCRQDVPGDSLRCSCGKATKCVCVCAFALVFSLYIILSGGGHGGVLSPGDSQQK